MIRKLWQYHDVEVRWIVEVGQHWTPFTRQFQGVGPTSRTVCRTAQSQQFASLETVKIILGRELSSQNSDFGKQV